MLCRISSLECPSLDPWDCVEDLKGILGSSALRYFIQASRFSLGTKSALLRTSTRRLPLLNTTDSTSLHLVPENQMNKSQSNVMDNNQNFVTYLADLLHQVLAK